MRTQHPIYPTICLTLLLCSLLLGYTSSADAQKVPEVPKTIIGQDGADMVLIPAGEFQMGSNEGDLDEKPVHTVYVDEFYMDKYEVTNAEYKKFVDTNPVWQKDRIDSRFHDGRYLEDWNGNNYPQGRANHPVLWVSWYAAMAYAEWANKRLPTEAEWEYAARGGLKGKKYQNGNTITARDANFWPNVRDTTPVDKYLKNGYELYDMAGNAWEWCLDAYDSDFYSTFPRNDVARNPLSPDNVRYQRELGDLVIRGLLVLRGGSYFSNGSGVRVSARSKSHPTFILHGGMGFRCVKDVTP